MNRIDFSIIIVNFNSADLLKKCLKSIYEYVNDVTYEIIMIDNASTDDSVNIIKNDYSQILIVENPENTGYSHAINCGLERAKGTYCAIMNPDTELNSDIFSSVYRFFQSNANIGTVGCIQIFSDGTAQRSFDRKRLPGWREWIDLTSRPRTWVASQSQEFRRKTSVDAKPVNQPTPRQLDLTRSSCFFSWDRRA